MRRRPAYRWLRRSHRESRGQATFEFMLMLPLFVLLVLFAVDMAIIGYQYVTVSNAVREGARFGAVNCGDGTCSPEEVQNLTEDRANGALLATDIEVGWPDGADRGDSVVVRAQHTHTLLFFPVDFPVASCAVMRLEANDSGPGLPSAPAEC